MVKNQPANARDTGLILGQEDPLEKEMATHSTTLAWESPWTEEPVGLQSKGPQRVELDLAVKQQPLIYQIIPPLLELPLTKAWPLVTLYIPKCLILAMKHGRGGEFSTAYINGNFCRWVIQWQSFLVGGWLCFCGFCNEWDFEIYDWLKHWSALEIPQVWYWLQLQLWVASRLEKRK